ncbi:MAG: hypothetical protein RMI91_01210 [Gemmatales bacterium]|nr:hypothetical protein [Gemmatales bacterium]MDW7993251.1 hypothetical protein [Gemmatales bacterium]
MPMPPYPVLCYEPNCGRPAIYKIAAEWSDGYTRELKTYGLTCADCLWKWYQRAVRSRQALRLAPGEYVGELAVYRFERGKRDVELVRDHEVETHLAARLAQSQSATPHP